MRLKIIEFFIGVFIALTSIKKSNDETPKHNEHLIIINYNLPKPGTLSMHRGFHFKRFISYGLLFMEMNPAETNKTFSYAHYPIVC